MKKLLWMLTLMMTTFSARAALPAIIPAPVRMEAGSGEFTLKPATVIVADEAAGGVARRLVLDLAPALGWTPAVQGEAGGAAIRLHVDGSLESALGTEGYRLESTTENVEITAAAPAGLYYGTRTLMQLLPPAILRDAPMPGMNWTVPAVTIEDKPRFGWRGGHLDSGRYFMPKDFVLKYIDLLALHKQNTFHWHLTDDQGWRIEIKRYPRLTEIGAWRPETVVGHAKNKPNVFDGRPHGGFYTQDDIREVVAYAAERFVTVVPEIEMPGHAQAAIAAYPELGVPKKQIGVSTNWGIHEDILNADDATVEFMQNVLAEVLELFPGRFIHVGGDEAPKKQWEQSESIQARIKELGLKDEHELQSWFIRQMDTWLDDHGRRLIGGDEIRAGGLAPGAAVMSWRGEKGGIAAAKMRHDVVMAPYPFTYLDYYQDDKTSEPLAIGGLLPISKVYSYNPIPAELTAEEARHILGVQGQVWTEYISTPQHAEYMAFPRMAAIAEIGWTPQEQRNEADFMGRLKTHLARLDAIGVNYRPLEGPRYARSLRQ